MEPANFRPYFSVDVETTGLDPNHHDLLSVAIIYDDGDIDRKPEDLPSIHIKRKLTDKTDLIGNPFAFAMNHKLLMECLGKAGEVDAEWLRLDEKEMAEEILSFLQNHSPQAPPVLAGKNPASLDIPIIDTHMARYLEHDVGSFKDYISHRVLDVGSLYFDYYGGMESLSRINNFTGRTAVTHDAYDDALDVVYAVRAKTVNYLKEK